VSYYTGLAQLFFSLKRCNALLMGIFYRSASSLTFDDNYAIWMAVLESHAVDITAQPSAG